MLPPGVIPMNRNQLSGPLGQLNDEFNYGPHSLDWDDVPPDLHERQVQEYRVVGDQYVPSSISGFGVPSSTNDLIRNIANGVRELASTLVLDRGLIGRVVLVPNTPVLVAQAQYLRGYLFLNPSLSVGLTTAGTLLSNTPLSSGVTNTSSLGVGNYNTLRLTLQVTNFAGVGSVTFDAQTLDPSDATTWITTQTIFSVNSNGNFYANLGSLGVDTDFRVSITVPAGVTLNASMGFVLKDGLEGTSSGSVQTIFLGPSGVTPDVGFPLLSGKEKGFYLRQNVELYAVTDGPTLPLRVFEL